MFTSLVGPSSSMLVNNEYNIVKGLGTGLNANFYWQMEKGLSVMIGFLAIKSTCYGGKQAQHCCYLRLKNFSRASCMAGGQRFCDFTKFRSEYR